MRSPMARQARPLGSAPRRMRRTLYCAPVSPAAFKSRSACWPRVSAVSKSATKIRFSGERGGLENLDPKRTPRNIVVITTNVKRKKSRPVAGPSVGLWFPQRPKVNLAQETPRALRDNGFHGVGNIFGAQHFRRVLWAAAGEFRGDAARADHTNADTAFPEIFRHAAGKTDDTPFGGAIDAAASEGAFAGQRTDVDDVAQATADHGRHHSAREQEDALKIGVQHAIPIGLGFFVGRAE